MTSKTSKDSFVSVRRLYGLNALRVAVVLWIGVSSFFNVFDLENNVKLEPTADQWAFSFSNNLLAHKKELTDNTLYKRLYGTKKSAEKYAQIEQVESLSLTKDGKKVSSLTRLKLEPITLSSSSKLGNSIRFTQFQPSKPAEFNVKDVFINPLINLPSKVLSVNNRKSQFLLGVGTYYELGNLNTLLPPVYSELSGFEEIVSNPLNSSQTNVNSAVVLNVGNQIQYNERWGMSVGLNFYKMQLSQMTYLRNKVTFNNRVLVSNGARANSNSQTQIVNQQSHTYFVDTVYSQVTARSIEVPIMINYDIIHATRYSVGLNVGVQASLFTNYHGVLESAYIPREEFTTSYKMFSTVSAICGIEANYKLNDGLGVYIKPTYQYGVSSHDNVVNPQRVAVVAGVKFAY